MTALLGAWLLGERLPRLAWWGVGGAFAGVMVLGLDPSVLDAPAALGLCLVSALALAARVRSPEP